MRKIILLLGPSSAGKTTLCSELRARHHWHVVNQDDIDASVHSAEEKQCEINNEIQKQLILSELKRQNLVTQLKDYMTEDEVLQLCQHGSLSISKGSHRQAGDNRVIQYQFESPEFKSLDKLQNALFEAGFNKREIEFIIIRVQLVGIAAHQAMHIVIKKALDEAFEPEDKSTASILDVVPASGEKVEILLDRFHERAAQYQKEHPDEKIETFTVLAHCDPQDLSKRILGRNRKAEDSNNLMDLREGHFPFNQLSAVVQTNNTNLSSPVKVGEVSKLDFMSIAYKHPRRIEIECVSKAPADDQINHNTYYLVKDIENNQWSMHFKQNNKIRVIQFDEFDSTNDMAKIKEALLKYDLVLSGRKPEDLRFEEFAKNAGDIRKAIIAFHAIANKGLPFFRRAVKEGIALSNQYGLPKNADVDTKLELFARNNGFDIAIDTAKDARMPALLVNELLEKIELVSSQRSASEFKTPKPG